MSALRVILGVYLILDTIDCFNAFVYIVKTLLDFKYPLVNEHLCFMFLPFSFHTFKPKVVSQPNLFYNSFSSFVGWYCSIPYTF